MFRPSLAALALAACLSAPGAPPPLGPAQARADLVLNEVLYDPAGTDDGNEWVELWNPGPSPVALAGVVIETADGSRPDVWTAAYRGASADTIPPRAPFLVRSLSSALQNGPDALRLVRDGVVLDLLGYGALEAASLSLGAPAPDAASGHSLARRVDGAGAQSNADDWEEEPAPTPGRANHPDERVALVPGGTSLDPVVPWPGETVVLRARIVNRGRLPLAASRWRLLAEWEDASPSGAGRGEALPAAVARGVALAPGESASVDLRLEAATAGPLRVRLRAAPAEGAAPASDLADTAWISGRTLAAPAVVNEIEFHDAGAGEWVELWFRDVVPDVGALALSDGSSPPRPVARGAVPRAATAGTLLVIAQDPAAVRARYGLDSTTVLGLAGSWPALNDGDGPDGFADLVRVMGSDSIPCDVIRYDARAVSRGGSLERLSPDLPGHQPGTFGECVDPARATPGRPNSLRAPEGGFAPRGALLLASGRLLRRGADRPPLLFRLTPEARGRSLVVQVYDLLGRRVRTLVAGQRYASEGAFAWDGRDAGGAWVRPGLYVVAAEAVAEDGRGPRRTAIPVAVSAAGTAR
ncbi:MAG TPA: lamin tail domain-containing protein [Candidatus Binatia bacterium]|nr:lamin tail domain-containing protein [Candidatus Binatia bacterium]